VLRPPGSDDCIHDLPPADDPALFGDGSAFSFGLSRTYHSNKTARRAAVVSTRGSRTFLSGAHSGVCVCARVCVCVGVSIRGREKAEMCARTQSVMAHNTHMLQTHLL